MDIKQIIELLKEQNEKNGINKIQGEMENIKYKAYFLSDITKIRIDLEITEKKEEYEDE